MPSWLSPGPVFAYEAVAATRRWQLYLTRAVFVTLMLVAMALLWLQAVIQTDPVLQQTSYKLLARLGQWFYMAVSTIQVALVLLAAPAVTAGSICLDRARGTLTHMLVTDLSDAEIILGKLSSRLLQVLALVATSVPVLALLTLLGGIIPEELLALTLTTLAVAVFACALTLAISVRATKINEVLITVYTVWAIWLLGQGFWSILAMTVGGPRVPAELLNFNPFVLVWAPYAWPNALAASDLFVFVGGMLGLSALLVGYSVLRLRAEVVNGSASVSASPRLTRSRAILARVFARWPRPSLDGNPVLWGEYHKGRPSRLVRSLWGLYFVLTLIGTGWGVYLSFRDMSGVGVEWLVLINGMGVTLGLLMISLSAPTALAEERTRGSLDVLLTTPLSTSSIVLGKWWGAYREVPKLAILPALGAVVLAIFAPDFITVPFGSTGPHIVRTSNVDRMFAALLPVGFVLAQGAVATSVGLALATWIAKPGRAVALSVSLNALFAFGWPAALELGLEDLLSFLLMSSELFPKPARDNPYDLFTDLFATLSPFGGQVYPLEAIYNEWNSTTRPWTWLTQCVTLLSLVAFAVGLLGLTVLTFNRCLGRVSTRPRRPGLEPRRREAVRRSARAPAVVR